MDDNILGLLTILGFFVAIGIFLTWYCHPRKEEKE
jgi:hypothetical protein